MTAVREVVPSALQRWRAELASGQRTATTFDATWRGACLELTALEAQASQVRESYLADARKLADQTRSKDTQTRRKEPVRPGPARPWGAVRRPGPARPWAAAR